MNHALKHHFKSARDWQREVMVSGGGMLTTFMDGSASQLTFASAPFGEHALSAFASAKRTIAFRKNLSARVKLDKKRSAAAKRGWKTRRGNL